MKHFRLFSLVIYLLINFCFKPSANACGRTGYRSLADHATFPVEHPHRQLDHVLLRGNIGAVTGSSAIALPLSDHRALIVDLADNED